MAEKVKRRLYQNCIFQEEVIANGSAGVEDKDVLLVQPVKPFDHRDKLVLVLLRLMHAAGLITNIVAAYFDKQNVSVIEYPENHPV